MPTNDYKAIAIDGAANVESQAQYLLDLGVGGSLEHGYQAGTALSAQVNKTLRQTTVAAASLAQYIVNALGVDVLDDGDVAGLAAKLLSAIQSTAVGSNWTTGDAKLTYKTAADPGWIMANDGTIGDAASGASTRSNADCQALFVLLWTNVPDAWAPVVGGRGASAAADWAAHKKLTLPKALGRAIAISGLGAGLTARTLGQNLGAETQDVVDHKHNPGTFQVTVPGQPNSGSGGAVGTAGTYPVTGQSSSPVATAPVADNNMPPETFMNAMIKL